MEIKAGPIPRLLVDPTGLEPVISSLQMRHSTTELRALFYSVYILL